MNPQPDPYQGTIVLVIFLSIFFYYYFKAYKNPPVNQTSDKNDDTWDYFAHGDVYYYDDGLQMIPAIDKPVAKQKPKQKPKIDSHPLYNDCKDALVALGYNKTQYKKVTNSIFLSSPPESVQGFLGQVFKKD